MVFRPGWSKKSLGRDHFVLLRFLAAERLRLEHGRIIPDTVADRRRHFCHDRGRHDLHQRDVPGKKARKLPGLDHDDRGLRHPGHGVHCPDGDSRGCVGLAAGVRLGRAWHAHPVVRTSAGRVAALVRESRPVCRGGRGAGPHRGSDARRIRRTADRFRTLYRPWFSAPSTRSCSLPASAGELPCWSRYGSSRHLGFMAPRRGFQHYLWRGVSHSCIH